MGGNLPRNSTSGNCLFLQIDMLDSIVAARAWSASKRATEMELRCF
jgi:hypothetical protein